MHPINQALHSWTFAPRSERVGPTSGTPWGCTCVDKLKTAPTSSQPLAAGTLVPRCGVVDVVKVATTWVSPRHVENPIPICANVHLFSPGAPGYVARRRLSARPPPPLWLLSFRQAAPALGPGVDGVKRQQRQVTLGARKDVGMGWNSTIGLKAQQRRGYDFETEQRPNTSRWLWGYLNGFKTSMDRTPA